MTDLYYCIAAYNEQNNIGNCLESLNQQTVDANIETIVCLNGCTDRTEEIVALSKSKFPELNIKTIHSEKGKSFAQNAIIQSVNERDSPLMFVDADVTLEKNCAQILLDDIVSIPGLIVAGAWPVPREVDDASLWEKFLFKVLHMRAFYPEAEVSVHDVSEYKSYAFEHPQTTMSPEKEIKSKIYFHGRTFMMKNADFFHIPEDTNCADDTFLPNFIHTTYGPGSIRIRFDAITRYKPYLSLKEHYNLYRRVFWDLDNIDTQKRFSQSRRMEDTKMDWKYIFSKGPVVSIKFGIYKAITYGEELVYRLLPKKTLSEVWQYEKK
jgi:glycosyltransferase involved in cell wall biosynthesis